MLDRVSITVSDLAAAERFYDAIMKALEWSRSAAATGGTDDGPPGLRPIAPHTTAHSCAIPTGTRSKRFAIARSKAFSSEVEPGSRQENASNQESRAPFRFNRNGKL